MVLELVLLVLVNSVVSVVLLMIIRGDGARESQTERIETGVENGTGELPECQTREWNERMSNERTKQEIKTSECQTRERNE